MEQLKISMNDGNDEYYKKDEYYKWSVASVETFQENKTVMLCSAVSESSAALNMFYVTLWCIFKSI